MYLLSIRRIVCFCSRAACFVSTETAFFPYYIIGKHDMLEIAILY